MDSIITFSGYKSYSKNVVIHNTDIHSLETFVYTFLGADCSDNTIFGLVLSGAFARSTIFFTMPTIYDIAFSCLFYELRSYKRPI